MLRWWVRGLLDLRGFVVAPTPRVETMRSIRTLRQQLQSKSACVFGMRSIRLMLPHPSDPFLRPALPAFHPSVGVFDVAVGSEFDDLGFGRVDGEHPAGGDAEGSAGRAEGQATPAFGGHGAGVGAEWLRFVVGRCAAAVAGRPRWALVPRQDDVQKLGDALYKVKADFFLHRTIPPTMMAVPVAAVMEPPTVSHLLWPCRSSQRS